MGDHTDSQPTIQLAQFLKFQGLVGTGGEAKLRIQRGDVRVNGAIETRRGRQLRPGDLVDLAGRQLVVPPWNDESPR
jgi:ribosome-associated protein